MTVQKTITPRAWAELMLLGLLWGGSFLAIRITLDEVPVLTMVLHRTGWAALALWVVVLAMRLPLPRDPGVWGAFLVMGLLNNIIPFGLMGWGQLYIESGLTSILNAATAVFAVLISAMIFADERLTLRRCIGVGVGFLGVALAIGPEALRSFDIRSTAQIAVLAGAVSYGLASAWARANLSELSPLVAAAGMLTASTIMLLPAALIFDGPIQFDLAPRTWIAIAYYALFATALAYILYYRLVSMAGSGNLMLVTLLIPPIAITLGALVLDETLQPLAFAGFALLALGLLILNGTLLRRWT
ncbi:MAG: DMT family transporter [Paracoccaceae bacterium]